MPRAKSDARRPHSRTTRHRTSFYAESDPYLYGGATELDTPLYGLMHETMFELVRQHLHASGKAEDGRAFAFLDIGSGKGAESIPILSEYSNSYVVALDRNAPVHDIFLKRAKAVLGKRAATNRCKQITGDIASPGGSRSLLQPLEEWGIGASFDLIVTTLTLHHLTTAQKRRAYKRIASVLAPGGLFINADLFTYTAPTMARMSNEFSVAWIRKQFTNPDPNLRVIRDALGNRASAMMNAWIEHCANHNIPDPIESWSHCRSDQTGGQAQMLLDAGFAEVACPFRYWSIGILWAKR